MIAKVDRDCEEEGGVMKIEEIIENTLLYDFYGELLTDHQKRIYEDVVFQDLADRSCGAGRDQPAGSS